MSDEKKVTVTVNHEALKELFKNEQVVDACENKTQQLVNVLEKKSVHPHYPTKITDERIIDGVNAFAEILQIGVDTFGMGNMTEAVICKLIEAGSYGYWRSVMGPKFDSYESDKKQSRKQRVIL